MPLQFFGFNPNSISSSLMRSRFHPLQATGVLVILSLLAALLAWPVVSIWSSWLHWDAQRFDMLWEMVRTVLPDYALTSLLLCILVGLGVALLGLFSAALVTLCDFPGRRWLEWALLLPLAMPAYVVAYAYTDFFQFSGPLQIALRENLGLQGALWPDIRNVWGAGLIFSLTLYPYVYLLVRTALMENVSSLMDAARLLGAGFGRRVRTVALPMARPAVAAGVALALMETLADFGVSSYFGVQSFTAGIYKTWLVMDDRIASAQLATLLLATVLILLFWERKNQQKARFASSRASGAFDSGAGLKVEGAFGYLLLGLGLLPVLLGFVLPLGILLWLWAAEPATVAWASFIQWGINSLRLGLITALLAVLIALVLAALCRQSSSVWPRVLTQILGLGYAIPGAVVVVGVLLPLGWLQGTTLGNGISFWVTATSLGLIWAYLVRFCAVALQSVQSGYARIPASMDESSRTLGVTGLSLFGRLHLPLLRRSSLAALMLVFVDVMKELPATLVLRPFNSDTLAVVAYQLARDERLGEAALPSLALVLFGLIPVILVSQGLRQGRLAR